MFSTWEILPMNACSLQGQLLKKAEYQLQVKEISHM